MYSNSYYYKMYMYSTCIDNLHLFTSLFLLLIALIFKVLKILHCQHQQLNTISKKWPHSRRQVTITMIITLPPPPPSPPPPSQLLADERKKNETVTYTYQHTCAKLDNKEKELLELRSKYDEMMSILERERTESEQKERRISQLEKSQKVQYKCTV